MTIIRVSPFTGETITKDIPVTEEEMSKFNAGESLEVAFPSISFEDREFIARGITQEDWDRAYSQGAYELCRARVKIKHHHLEKKLRYTKNFYIRLIYSFPYATTTEFAKWCLTQTHGLMLIDGEMVN
jgi:hypothetical protein